MTKWMIYGATGYTGRLIAEKAVAEGMAPVLAGRGDAVRAIADDLGLDCRVFGVARAADHLDGIDLVLNCAGPFSATAAPMIDACLAAGAHYLDITGEIAVFEHAASLNARAKAAGVVLCPGVGFDVVPTDCVALALKEALPDATHLSLGFDTKSPMSPGTAKTAVEGFADGGKIRIERRIETVAVAARIREIDFGYGRKSAMTIPWGDVSTAYWTTGIPNIDAYVPAPAPVAYLMRFLGGAAKPLLGRPGVQAWLKRKVDEKVTGPTEEQRVRLKTAVWGEVRNAKGERRTARIETANGYALTVDAAIAVTRYLRDAAPDTSGHMTPARLCGWQLVERLPGSGHIEVTSP